jgi:hypothetical protein
VSSNDARSTPVAPSTSTAPSASPAVARRQPDPVHLLRRTDRRENGGRGEDQRHSLLVRGPRDE